MPNEINSDTKAKLEIESLSKKQTINQKKQIIKAQVKDLEKEKDKLEEEWKKKETVKDVVKRLNKTKIGQRLADLKRKLARVEKAENKSRNNAFSISSLSSAQSSISSQTSLNSKIVSKSSGRAI